MFILSLKKALRERSILFIFSSKVLVLIGTTNLIIFCIFKMLLFQFSVTKLILNGSLIEKLKKNICINIFYRFLVFLCQSL